LTRRGDVGLPTLAAFPDVRGEEEPAVPLSREELLEQVTGIAKGAGDVVMSVYRSDFAARSKDDASPVTEADERAEALILAGLRQLTPEIPIVAEEEVAAGRCPEVAVSSGWSIRSTDQGIHQPQRRVHRQHRPRRGRQADARCRPRTGARPPVRRGGGCRRMGRGFGRSPADPLPLGA
jgi:hypothetical protein